MSSDLRELIQISRPRFWIYVFGPAFLGATVVFLRLGFSPILLALLVYFLFPANLLIYGINDVFDYETDRLNAKKQGYEQALPPDRRRFLWKGIALSHVPFLPLLVFLPLNAVIVLLVFWCLSIGYSAPPLRFKTKPVLDSASNVLYLVPFLVLYFAGGGAIIHPLLLIAGSLWCMAMHAYSAVPDIEADRRAGLATIATWAGGEATLRLCFIAYLASGLLAASVLGWPLATLGLVYVGLMIASFQAYREKRLLRVYRLFPRVNMVAGFCLFLVILFRAL